MKSTGIVRKVDELGRIVLPIEMRRTLDIAEKDALEIYVDGDNIILRKYQPTCIFCDNAKNVINFKGKNVCPDCIAKLKLTKEECEIIVYTLKGLKQKTALTKQIGDLAERLSALIDKFIAKADN